MNTRRARWPTPPLEHLKRQGRHVRRNLKSCAACASPRREPCSAAYDEAAAALWAPAVCATNPRRASLAARAVLALHSVHCPLTVLRWTAMSAVEVTTGVDGQPQPQPTATKPAPLRSCVVDCVVARPRRRGGWLPQRRSGPPWQRPHGPVATVTGPRRRPRHARRSAPVASGAWAADGRAAACCPFRGCGLHWPCTACSGARWLRACRGACLRPCTAACCAGARAAPRCAGRWLARAVTRR